MTWLRMSLRVSASVLSSVVATMNWTVTGPAWGQSRVFLSPFPFPSPLHIVAGIDSLACVLVRAMTVVRVEWGCDGNMSAVKIVFPKRKITV